MTYHEIAKDWTLFCEYANSMGAMTFCEFQELTIQDRVELLTTCFGPESGETPEKEDNNE